MRAADEAYRVGPGPAAESYLQGDVVVEVALRAGAEAIHPGYGFLAENAAFARLVEEAGLVWIGPPPAAIELMGSKTAARAAMRAAGVPIIPGGVDPVGTGEEVAALGEELGYPLIVKAAADASLDGAVDALFAGANDLVVNTPYVWGIGRGPTELTSLPQFLQKDRVLVYRPPGANGANAFAPPEGVLTEEALGVHHCNLFGQRRVQEALRAWLTER